MYDLNQASEIIKDSYFTHESITIKQIKKELTNYLDELVEEINNDPLYFFKDNHQFWKKLDKACIQQEQKQKKQQQQNVA